MARIVVLGGGICGMATAMLLARDGHEVTVLERDAEPVPESVDEAWSAWMRPGVAQFRQPHFLQARVRHVLDRELPDVRDALLAAGATTVDPIARLPAAIEDRRRRAGDERFVSITARRATTELVFARAAENEPGVTVRRGVEVTALDMHQVDGTSHLTGVRTTSGEALKADLTVDAMGRGSRLPRLLRAAGAARVHQEAEDSGFIYFTRFFRSADGACPEPRTPALVTPLGSISILTMPSDCDTWSVTFFISSGDQPLKRLRFVDRWMAVVAACPLHTHWLDGEPISDVLPMAGVLDRYRRLVADGRPVAIGLAIVGDSWACPNPSLARGLALGLDHVARLRDTVRSGLEDPREFAFVWDAVTEGEFTPWYRATVGTDRARLAEMEALRSRTERPRADDVASAVRARFPAAAGRDPDLFRALMEIVGCLTDELPQAPGPTRAELLELVS